jgi:hypothetical protein
LKNSIGRRRRKNQNNRMESVNLDLIALSSSSYPPPSPLIIFFNKWGRRRRIRFFFFKYYSIEPVFTHPPFPVVVGVT